MRKHFQVRQAWFITSTIFTANFVDFFNHLNFCTLLIFRLIIVDNDQCQDSYESRQSSNTVYSKSNPETWFVDDLLLNVLRIMLLERLNCCSPIDILLRWFVPVLR